MKKDRDNFIAKLKQLQKKMKDEEQ